MKGAKKEGEWILNICTIYIYTLDNSWKLYIYSVILISPLITSIKLLNNVLKSNTNNLIIGNKSMKFKNIQLVNIQF